MRGNEIQAVVDLCSSRREGPLLRLPAAAKLLPRTIRVSTLQRWVIRASSFYKPASHDLRQYSSTWRRIFTVSLTAFERKLKTLCEQIESCETEKEATELTRKLQWMLRERIANIKRIPTVDQ
jgi:hypothetical protein